MSIQNLYNASSAISSIPSTLVNKISYYSSSLSKYSFTRLQGLSIRAGFNGASTTTNDFEEASGLDIEDDCVIILGSPNVQLNGVYIKSTDINGLPHFERKIETSNSKLEYLHIYWTGTQWVIHRDLDYTANSENLLAYAKVRVNHPIDTIKHWYVKVGKQFETASSIVVSSNFENESLNSIEKNLEIEKNRTEEVFGVPRKLLPLYIAFMLDSIAVGMAMPLLPFFVMELGAKALQLSLVVSSNYVIQMFGCLVMGQVSDMIGRKFVILACLAASSISYLFVSQSNTLLQVTLARLIVGSCGGLVPVIQTCVADVVHHKDRPRYFGRVTATFGLGFVLGPAFSALLPNLSIRGKIRLAAILPLMGFVIALIFFRETRVKESVNSSTSSTLNSPSLTPLRIGKTTSKESRIVSPLSSQVILLVLNGFFIMYAFATETIYAMFLKDTFGHGERTLSSLFAVNGLFIGLFQVFLIKPLVSLIGKHMTLIFGNVMLALGMIGVALVRQETIHFILFTIHIVGYSIADTALASLISKYSSRTSQGRDLSLNQAAQACARVISPLVAGILYEKSKGLAIKLPLGAIPFLLGALFPTIGIAIPTFLFYQNNLEKKKREAKLTHS